MLPYPAIVLVKETPQCLGLIAHFVSSGGRKLLVQLDEVFVPGLPHCARETLMYLVKYEISEKKA